MKRIQLRKEGKNQSAPTFRAIMEHSPQKPLSVAEIRARVKVLDKLDALDPDADTLVLEDAEHVTLKKGVEEFPWQQASRELLELIDDVLEAKAVSAAHLKAVESDARAPTQDAAEMIKKGRRIPRGAYRIPRKWLLQHTRAVPVDRTKLVAGPVQFASPAGEFTSPSRDINFQVAVTYLLQDGSSRVFSGRFLARNASYAEQLGRLFVRRYIRPAHITNIVALPN